MAAYFNILFRIVSTLLGILMISVGGIWILQGLHIAFPHSFMFGNRQWVLWGTLLALFGLGQAIWSNTGRR